MKNNFFVNVCVVAVMAAVVILDLSSSSCVADAFVVSSAVGGRRHDHFLSSRHIAPPDAIRHNKNKEKESTTRVKALWNVQDAIYDAQSSASQLASFSLSSSSGGTSISSVAVLYLAGLLTSFSPCSLSLLPLTISYISTAAGEREDRAALLPTLAFASGLAFVFCGLGLSASLLGGVFGNGGQDTLLGKLLLAVLSSGVCILMGLQLLDLVNLPLPNLDLAPSFPLSSTNANTANDDQSGCSDLYFDEDGTLLPSTTTTQRAKEEEPKYDSPAIALARTFFLGGSSALVASPCATPVLTSILAFVAASRDPTLGALFLFTYTIGYSTPLLVVGATGGQALVNARYASETTNSDDGGVVNGMARIGEWVTPLTAAVLICYGTSNLLTNVFGDASLAGLAS